MKGKLAAKKPLVKKTLARKSLVVVESPTKVKTIQKYLDSRYIVKASMGHVRDLPKSKLGVDEKKSFKPDYRVLPAKKKVLDDLKKAAEKVDALYIATDPDREGEAIGWHLAQELGVPKAKTYRIMFNEITERAVKAAFQHPGKIDTNKVDAQQARRILDRLVGYKLSPLLWQKIRRGLSAGRVQSVAVRLITEREREVLAFVATEYWSLHARLKGKNPPEFTATLREFKGEKAVLATEAATMAVMTSLHGASWRVKSVTRGERRRNPAPPFITSTLQQEASRKLHFTAKKTMMLAQQLYEGIELGSEGAVGLITYMRTDAVRVSREAQDEARSWITGRLGREYLPNAPPSYKAKKSAQEAHEAVRPSAVAREPKAVARYLSKDQLALYRLVWERFLASQMLPAVYDTVAADIEAGKCLFRAQGSTLKFAGFMAVYVESREESEAVPEEEQEAVVPPLSEGEMLKLLALDPKQHFTQPPPRYTEASLVKTLEERGIGRPSTYAQILSTIQDREVRAAGEGHAVPDRAGDARHGPAGAVLSRDHGHRLHRPARGVARQGRGGRRRLGGAGREVQQAVRQGHPQGEVGHAGQQGRGGHGREVPRVRQARPREVGAVRQVPGVLRLPRLQVHEGPQRPREARRRDDRRGLPGVRQAHGHQARPFRQVHRLLGLPRVQDDQARHPRDRLLRDRLRRPARRAPEQAGQDLLRLQQVPRLQVRRLGAPHRPTVSALRRTVLDGTDRQGRQANPRVHPRRVRLQGRGRPFGGVSLRP